MTGLRFFWNGIKGADGKLQGCIYSQDAAGWITIYGRKYRDFSPEVRRLFVVENDSDPTTDYCENDHIRVLPDHPLYAQVAQALALREAHYERRFAHREQGAA